MSAPKDDGGPVFPAMRRYEIGDKAVANADGGMTLRDYFAGQALAGLAARDIDIEAHIAAKAAYFVADAMLAERATK